MGLCEDRAVRLWSVVATGVRDSLLQLLLPTQNCLFSLAILFSAPTRACKYSKALLQDHNFGGLGAGGQGRDLIPQGQEPGTEVIPPFALQEVMVLPLDPSSVSELTGLGLQDWEGSLSTGGRLTISSSASSSFSSGASVFRPSSEALALEPLLGSSFLEKRAA